MSEPLFLSFWFNIVTSKHIFPRLFSDLQVLLIYPNTDKIPGQKWSLLSFSVEMNWFQPLIFENNGQFPQFHICLLKCTDSFCLVKSGLGQHVLITYKSNPRILHRNSSIFICLPISLCIPSGLRWIHSKLLARSDLHSCLTDFHSTSLSLFFFFLHFILFFNFIILYWFLLNIS